MIEPSAGLATPVPVAPQTPLTELTLQEEVGDPNANELDRDAFLKLLVAQLRYQDPLNPNDPAEFMATTAQFTTIEKLDELTEQGANNAIVTGLSMASSLVGRSIAYVGVDDVARTGVVNSAAVVGGEVRLLTEEGPVSLTKVTAIGSGTEGLLDPGLLGLEETDIDNIDNIDNATDGAATGGAATDGAASERTQSEPAIPVATTDPAIPSELVTIAEPVAEQQPKENEA
ncbi:MAG: flagellar hook capping FlgD N-terminal domain-containing protein [Acidimicrobiales bacterium]